MREARVNRLADAGQIEAGHGEHLFAAAVFQIHIGQAQVQDRHEDAMRGQAFRHRATRAACDGVVFQRDEGFMRVRQLEDHRLVKRLHEAHVDQGGIEFGGDFRRGGQHRAEAEQGKTMAATTQLRLADR